MKDNRTSETAIFTALQRAVHQVFDAEPKILNDPLAVSLLPDITAAQMMKDGARWRRPAERRLRSAFVFRSRFVEDELEAFRVSGSRQFLILGAGLETFPYRQPPWSDSFRIFEVDHPLSQALKRRRLEACAIRIPSNTFLCPVDFEAVSLVEGLAAAGFDRSSPTLISALGVTQYLTRDALEALFKFGLSLPPSSRLIFSFVVPERLLPDEERDLYVLGAAAAASRGEPWLSCFGPDQLRDWLARMPFSQVSLLTPAEAQRRYFEDRADGLCAPTLEQMAVAVV